MIADTIIDTVHPITVSHLFVVNFLVDDKN